jgi:uncharacterized membrane protein YdbT with pleckstrin-like domain
MSFLVEQRIARIRPRGSKLFFPNLVLFVVCFVAAFFSGRLTEQWQNILLWTACGLVVFLFWFLPILRYASTFLEVTTTRVLYRSGLLGQKRQEVSLTKIKDVQLTKSRSISIVIDGQEPLVITGIPKHKMVAVEIDRLAAAI